MSSVSEQRKLSVFKLTVQIAQIENYRSAGHLAHWKLARGCCQVKLNWKHVLHPTISFRRQLNVKGVSVSQCSFICWQSEQNLSEKMLLSDQLSVMWMNEHIIMHGNIFFLHCNLFSLNLRLNFKESKSLILDWGAVNNLFYFSHLKYYF